MMSNKQLTIRSQDDYLNLDLVEVACQNIVFLARRQYLGINFKKLRMCKLRQKVMVNPEGV